VRVSEREGARRPERRPAARFGEILRRAEAMAKAATVGAATTRKSGPKGSIATQAAGGDQPSPTAAGDGPAAQGRRGGPHAVPRRPGSDAAEGILAAGPDGRGTAASAPAGPSPAAPDPGRVTLAMAVRAIVPAVEAFRLGGREALALDFGRALGVELKRAPGGVEVALAAAPALASAARAELPGLLRALAARGVPVVRAEVRERGAPAGQRR